MIQTDEERQMNKQARKQMRKEQSKWKKPLQGTTGFGEDVSEENDTALLQALGLQRMRDARAAQLAAVCCRVVVSFLI